MNISPLLATSTLKSVIAARETFDEASLRFVHDMGDRRTAIEGAGPSNYTKDKLPNGEQGRDIISDVPDDDDDMIIRPFDDSDDTHDCADCNDSKEQDKGMAAEQIFFKLLLKIQFHDNQTLK